MKDPKYGLICVLLIVFSSTYAQKEKKNINESGEILYNGIQLPTNWPPKSIDLKSFVPLEVPYLNEIPKVIDISVGRQLFIDDFLIEQNTLIRNFHQANKYKGNPVLFPTTSHEKRSSIDNNKDVLFLGPGGVFYDPLDSLYKMFYTAGWRGGLAMATSKDLLTWIKPKLNKDGSNILLHEGSSYDQAGQDNSIWLDLNASNSTERIKYLTDRLPRDKDRGSHTLQVSDGNKWSQPIHTNVNLGDDYSTFFFNPFRKKWVISVKMRDYGPNGGRKRRYLEKDEFLDGWDWKNSVAWARADSLDKRDPNIGDKPQLYNLNAVAYESILLGQFYIHLGPDNKICEARKEPKITELKLGYSRDGFHWDRPDRNAFIAASRLDGTWDKGYLHGTPGVCLVKGDSLYFPYCGTSGIASDGTRGMYTGMSIGIATLRRDGFASLEATAQKGFVLTRPLKFNGKYLFVNVNTKKGTLRAEILNENNQIIPGYEAQNCIPVKEDKTLHRIEWRDAKDLSKVINKKIKIKFYVENGSLYSFWISPDIYGASYGYQGGGSAGLDGVIDNKGLLNY